MSALLQRALSGGTLANPAKLTALVGSTLKTLTVDKALAKDLLGLADQLKDVSTDDVTFATVPLTDVDYRTPTGESAVLWDKDAARDMFRRIAADEPLVKPAAAAKASTTPKPSASPGLTVPPSRIAVRVVNGTAITGLGARAKADLLEAGFQVPSPPGDTSRRTYEATVVRYPAGREDSARTVAAAIPGAELRQAGVTGVEVIVGRSYDGVKKVTVKETSPSAGPSPASTPVARTATQNICKK